MRLQAVSTARPMRCKGAVMLGLLVGGGCLGDIDPNAFGNRLERIELVGEIGGQGSVGGWVYVPKSVDVYDPSNVPLMVMKNAGEDGLPNLAALADEFQAKIGWPRITLHCPSAV